MTSAYLQALSSDWLPMRSETSETTGNWDAIIKNSHSILDEKNRPMLLAKEGHP